MEKKGIHCVDIATEIGDTDLDIDTDVHILAFILENNPQEK